MRFFRNHPRFSIPFLYLPVALFAVAIVTVSEFHMLPSQASLVETDPSGIEVAYLLPSKPANPDPLTEALVQFPQKDPVFETNKPDLPLASIHTQKRNRTTVAVKKGDTLSSIFNRLDIYPELPRILKLGKDVRRLKTIYPGQKLHFTLSGKKIDHLEFELNQTTSLNLYRDGNSFAVEELNQKPERILKVASGSISSSLFLAGRKSGMSDLLIMDLARIYDWDIDFALDIRRGDTFTVLYEKLYLDDEEVGDGNIVAAEFVNNGNTYRAYRYTDQNNNTEYYSPDGKSLRKSFLRTPVNLAYVSSHFNPRRLHPILNIFRAHKGVDYAAATGTPIMATGAGRVIYRGTKGQYGKTIVLRHGNMYTTLYAHMSRYARGTSVGSLVKQGQTIGYVGRTGLATGPHLHYEFRVNGVHRNPLKIKLPSTKPLPNSELVRFRATIQPLVAQLDLFRQNRFAMQDL